MRDLSPESQGLNEFANPPAELADVLGLKSNQVPRFLYLGPVWVSVVLSPWRSATYTNHALNITNANPTRDLLPADTTLIRRIIALSVAEGSGTGDDFFVGINRAGSTKVIATATIAANGNISHVDLFGAFPLVVPPGATIEVGGIGGTVVVGATINFDALVVNFPAGAEMPSY